MNSKHNIEYFLRSFIDRIARHLVYDAERLFNKISIWALLTAIMRRNKEVRYVQSKLFCCAHTQMEGQLKRVVHTQTHTRARARTHAHATQTRAGTHERTHAWRFKMLPRKLWLNPISYLYYLLAQFDTEIRTWARELTRRWINLQAISLIEQDIRSCMQT